MTQVAGESGDPRDFFRLLWRRKWVLLACVVLIPVATYVVSTRLPKTYEASTVLQLQEPGAATPDVGNLVGGPTDTQTIERVAALIQTNGVADQASEELGEPKGSQRGAAQATANEDTGFITIVAEGSTAERAAEVTTAFADAVRTTREQQGVQRVDNAIKTLQRQLDQVTGDPLQRRELEGQLQSLRALREAQGENLEVIEPATPPSSAASPQPVKNAAFALVLALLLGAALVALLDRLDRRIHDPEDLEALAGAPLLVRIPPEAFGTTAADGDAAVAFQMLRDSLMFFNVDEPLRSLIVVSSLKGEGKTTVATNLAMAYARARKRVILVDADLRSPELGPRLGLPRDPGLSHVLSGEREYADLMHELEPFGSYLRVLTGGSPPPNPSELLNSKRMVSLLDQLESECDLLIIDTPPLLLVSDAFGLLEQASGAVAVSRLEQTPKDAVRRMAKLVATVQTRLLGVVATGGAPPSAVGHGYGYGYGYGYGELPKQELAPAAILTPAEPGTAEANGHAPEKSDDDDESARRRRLFRSN